MELVDLTQIEKYAQRNTSPKMEIEAKYVKAFLDALLNSTSVQDVYSVLKDEMHNGDSYVIYNSYALNARNLNREPFRSIIAYAMLKKDFRLFELISASIFTGSVVEYHGTDLYSETTLNTDEVPLKYTDSGVYTDMTPGLIQIGFKNYYCDNPLPDGTGSEYQTIEELRSAIVDFDNIITLTKPARVGILLFYVPWCFISGDKEHVETCGIDETDNFEAPFGDPVSMEILSTIAPSEYPTLYSDVTMYEIDEETEAQLPRSIESERTITETNEFIIFDYNFRCQSSIISADKEYIWGIIKITSGSKDKIYSRAIRYKPDEEYFERYDPIMLRINDNDPDGPCLALEIENDVPTIGAMFYVRDKV